MIPKVRGGHDALRLLWHRPADVETEPTTDAFERAFATDEANTKSGSWIPTRFAIAVISASLLLAFAFLVVTPASSDALMTELLGHLAPAVATPPRQVAARRSRTSMTSCREHPGITLQWSARGVAYGHHPSFPARTDSV